MTSHESPTHVADIENELRNFIHLLQTSDPTTYKSLKSSGRLSVILSASEPESSSMDKENCSMSKDNSRQSANRSVKNSEFQTLEYPLITNTIKELQATGLSKLQQKLMGQLAVCIDEIVKKSAGQDSRIFQLQEQLAREKKGTDEVLEALVKMDEQQKDLWKTYYQLSDKFKAKSGQVEAMSKQNQSLKEQIDTYKKQLKFVKNLVYVANQNYESLESKYNRLYSKSHAQSRHALRPALVLREKRSEKNLLTERSDISKRSNKVLYSPYQDAKLLCSPYQDNKKHTISPDQHEVSSSCSPVRKNSKSIKSRKSISPLQKDKENIECNFKDVYRKMLMKNLKAKNKINDA